MAAQKLQPRYIATSNGMMRGYYRLMDTATGDTIQTGESKRVLQAAADELNRGEGQHRLHMSGWPLVTPRNPLTDGERTNALSLRNSYIDEASQAAGEGDDAESRRLWGVAEGLTEAIRRYGPRTSVTVIESEDADEGLYEENPRHGIRHLRRGNPALLDVGAQAMVPVVVDRVLDQGHPASKGFLGIGRSAAKPAKYRVRLPDGRTSDVTGDKLRPMQAARGRGMPPARALPPGPSFAEYNPVYKEPWEMSKAEFTSATTLRPSGRDSYLIMPDSWPFSGGKRWLVPGTRSKVKAIEITRPAVIHTALSMGKTVPASILNEYPGLFSYHNPVHYREEKLPGHLDVPADAEYRTVVQGPHRIRVAYWGPKRKGKHEFYQATAILHPTGERNPRTPQEMYNLAHGALATDWLASSTQATFAPKMTARQRAEWRRVVREGDRLHPDWRQAYEAEMTAVYGPGKGGVYAIPDISRSR